MDGYIKRFRLWAWLLFLLLNFTGCANQFFYNSLPFWADFYISDYIDMNPKQQKLFSENIESLHAWHRDVEIPKMLQLIRNIQRDLQTESSLKKIVYYDHALKNRMAVVMEKAAPSFVVFLQSLTDAQVKDWLQKIDQKMKDKENKAKQKTLTARKNEYYQRLKSRIEFWIGDVNSAQRELLGKMVDYHFSMEPIFTKIKGSIRQQVETLLQSRHQADFLQKMMKFIQRMIHFSNEDYEKEWHEYRLKRWQLIHEIRQSLDANQERHLMKKLQSIENDMLGVMK